MKTLQEKIDSQKAHANHCESMAKRYAKNPKLLERWVGRANSHWSRYNELCKRQQW